MIWRPLGKKDKETVCHRCRLEYPRRHLTMTAIEVKGEPHPLCIYCYTDVKRAEDQLAEELKYTYGT